MSDIPARRDPGPHVELTTHPNPEHARGPAPEQIQPDPALQADHPVSGVTMTIAGFIGLVILGTVIYGLNNSETPTATLANASDTLQPQSDQAKETAAKTQAAQPAASSASVTSKDTQNAARTATDKPAAAAAKPQPANSGGASSNPTGAAPSQPPKS